MASKTLEEKIYNGQFQTTVYIPEKTMRLLDQAFRLDQIKFTRLVCDALEHYASCPVDNPRSQLERMGALINEHRDRITKLELKFAKHHKSRVS